MEQNGIVKIEQGLDLGSREVISTLKATVAVGLTDAEFALFAEHVKATKLNPFKKEVWAIKAGNRLQIMTGINGYWQIANSHPQFDGAETGMITKDGEWVKSVPGSDFLGAWCRVYRKDRKIAMEGEAFVSDYRKDTPLWKQSPRIMIKKVAESIALRKAFPQELNGTYTAEEMPPEYGEPAKPEPVVVEAQRLPQRPTQFSFTYDISGVASERKDDAVRLLRKAGAQTDDELLLYWESPVQIKSLEKYLLEVSKHD